MCAGVHIAGWRGGGEGDGGARPAGGRAAGVSEATSVVSLSAQCLVGGRAPLSRTWVVCVCVCGRSQLCSLVCTWDVHPYTLSHGGAW